MIEFIKKNIRKVPIVYKFLVKIKTYFNSYSKKSFSQFGEDIVLSTFIDVAQKGFYVDIGAYHPIKFSNTYYFYKNGWNGINIDARPESMNLFKIKRKRDINLEIGISEKNEESDFYIFKEPAYNTFSKERSDLYIKQSIKFEKRVSIKTRRIQDILDQYLPMNSKISFMSIDVEGLDLVVLESNNWEKYCPKYILIESHDFNIENVMKSKIYNFLINKKYKLVSVVSITLIFKYEPNL